jgi:hypothetical protein
MAVVVTSAVSVARGQPKSSRDQLGQKSQETNTVETMRDEGSRERENRERAKAAER